MTRNVLCGLGLSLAALAIPSSVLGVQRKPAPPTEPRPNLEVVSLAANQVEVAPETVLTATLVVRNKGAKTGPFSVGLFYALGPAAGGAVPKSARRIGTVSVDRGLTKGQSATFGAEVRVPSCEECGRHSLYAAADPENVMSETSETDNVRSVSLDVARDHLGDLRVENVSVSPDRGATSSSVTLRATVRNASRFFAQGPFRVSAYCGAGPDLTPSDKRLYSFTVPLLGPNETVGVDRALSLQPSCPVHALSTWVGIVADDQDTVRESNEQNGARGAPFWVFRAPDLTTRPVDVSARSGPAGTPVLVSYRVKNTGESAAGQFRTGVYWARKGAPLASGTLLDAVTLPSLAANTESGMIQHAVTVPKVARGRYQLGVVVDLDGTNGELRKRNNFAVEHFDVTEANLTDVFFSARQKEAAPGTTVDLRFAVHDTGADPAPASTIALYYSDDPRFDRERDVLLGRVDLRPIAARAASPEKSLSVTIPEGATEGYRFLLGVIDERDEVAETDETDNVALESLRVRQR